MILSVRMRQSAWMNEAKYATEEISFAVDAGGWGSITLKEIADSLDIGPMFTAGDFINIQFHASMPDKRDIAQLTAMLKNLLKELRKDLPENPVGDGEWLDTLPVGVQDAVRDAEDLIAEISKQEAR